MSFWSVGRRSAAVRDTSALSRVVVAGPTRRVRFRSIILVAAAFAVVPSAAEAAVTLDPVANRVSTPRLEFDFGDGPGNVERLDSVRWRDSGSTLTGNLAANSVATGCGVPAQPQRAWGYAGSAAGPPQPVGDGTTGTWTPRGGRSVEINSTRPDSCGGYSPPTPVRTRYTFFNVGDAAGKVRVERTISFSALSPDDVNPSMRAYVPELSLASYAAVVHPNAAGTALVVDASQNPAVAQTDWNQTWVALNNPVTNAGVMILRETASNPTRLMLENDGSSNSSGVDLIKPATGWKAPVTETEWLCFYDATSWPPPQRSPTFLPSACSVVPVPINSAAPSTSGVPVVAGTLTANVGAWDGAASLALQWLRCTAGACAAIPGATDASYTAGLADEGKQLRVDVTATATGGESDSASSPLTVPVAAGPPQNTASPTISGEARAGETLAGATGSWSSSPSSFLYQWLRCATAASTSCVDLAGATTSTYKLTRDDVGATMRLRVRAVGRSGTSVAAESAQTSEVLREVIRARLTLSPNPTCTGVSTTFDGSRSTSPSGPITDYRYTYKSIPSPVLSAIVFGALVGSGDTGPAISNYLATVSPIVLEHGANAATVTEPFTWNRQLAKAESVTGGRSGDFARDPIYVTLTVTDGTGATDSSVPLSLSFAQSYSSQPRTRCPLTLRPTPFAFAQVHKAAFTSTKAVSARIPCATRIACAGSLKVVRTASKPGATVAKAKPIVLAGNPFFTIEGRHTASVRAKLTKAGQGLARHGKPVRVTLRITSINTVTGQQTTRSTLITLTGRNKGQL